MAVCPPTTVQARLIAFMPIRVNRRLININLRLFDEDALYRNDQLMVDRPRKEDIRKRIVHALEHDPRNAKEIAKEIEVSEQAVSKWKRTGQIATENIAMFCQVLGLSYAWFLEGKPPMYLKDISPSTAKSILSAISNTATPNTKRQAELLQERIEKGEMSEEIAALINLLFERTQKQ